VIVGWFTLMWRVLVHAVDGYRLVWRLLRTRLEDVDRWD
jgi:hypothetical protein